MPSVVVAASAQVGRVETRQAGPVRTEYWAIQGIAHTLLNVQTSTNQSSSLGNSSFKFLRISATARDSISLKRSEQTALTRQQLFDVELFAGDGEVVIEPSFDVPRMTLSGKKSGRLQSHVSPRCCPRRSAALLHFRQRGRALNPCGPQMLWR